MIDRIKVLAHGFTTDGDAFQHNFGFLKGGDVSFDRIGVVGPLWDLSFMQSADGVYR